MLYPISARISDSTKSRCGYINRHGEVIIEPVFAGCSHFFEGVAAAMIDETRSHFIDMEGRIVMPFDFSGLARFCGGLCGLGVGYIDHSGNWKIRSTFVVTGAFCEGRAIVSMDGQHFHFVDMGGIPIAECAFEQCLPFSEGLAAVCLDKQWGYIDHSGDLEIPAVFEGKRVTSFHYGMAGVQIDEKWGFIDHAGRFIIKPQFEDVRPFYDCRASVRMKGKWGIIDLNGSQVVECVFDEIGRYDGGLAPARLGVKAGFLSTDGQWAIEPSFDKSYAFFGELAVVRRGNAYCYVNRRGEVLWTSEPWAAVQYPPPPVL